MTTKANIVLVHGAWGDGSHWRHVIPPLHAKGYRVSAVQNPLTSLTEDVDRTRKLAAAQEAPTLLVGHSYGGAVITGAGHAPNVVGLVYVAAFAPDQGDSLASIFARREPPAGAGSIRPDKDGFLWIDRDKFRESFCQDLDETEALVMAHTQKPIAARCFDDKSGPPAWKVKPMAERINSKKTITLQASHASLASHAAEVVALIEEAVGSLSSRAAA